MLESRPKSREARGHWPDDRSATCDRQQGAKASPETGTIGLEPSNGRRRVPRRSAGFSFPGGGESGQCLLPGRNVEMPWKTWIHQCGHASSSRSSECRQCGGTGIYDGWRGSVTELMCAYARTYGLVPIGRHRAFANEVFAGTTAPCGGCAGRGYVENGADDWARCSRCNGCGKIFLIPPEQVEALRDGILAGFPEAASPRGSARGKQTSKAGIQ